MDFYVTEDFYTDEFLRGRKAQLPLKEFMFWEQKARAFVDLYTFDRIKNDRFMLEQYKPEIGRCICELAEHLYRNEGNENKQSEGISGRSVTYLCGIEYKICQRHLFGTGLLYRGSQ